MATQLYDPSQSAPKRIRPTSQPRALEGDTPWDGGLRVKGAGGPVQPVDYDRGPSKEPIPTVPPIEYNRAPSKEPIGTVPPFEFDRAPNKGPTPPFELPSPPPGGQVGMQLPPPPPGGGLQVGGLQQGSGYAGVDPKASFSAQQALDHIQKLIGRPLTQAEIQQATQIAGYSGQGNLTGDQLNKVIAEAAKLTGNQFTPWGTPQTQPTPQPQTPDPLKDEFLKRLTEMMGKPSFDPNDPINAQQMALNSVAQQRTAERRRASAAERAAARGDLSSGSFDVKVDQIEADRGRAEQTFESELAVRELEGQRSRLMQALQIGSQYMSQQQQLQLQEKLSMIDAQLKEKGLALQDKLGTGDLDLRRFLGKGQLGLGLLSAMLNDRQFAERLGFDYTQLQSLMNRDAMTQLLGGF